jgi:hypothetical protein
LTAGLLLLLASLPVAGRPHADTVRARITYIMGTTAYLDAGRDDGLVEGHEVHVVRDAQRIAVLKVTSLASHRAAATVGAEVRTAPVVGDTVEFLASRVIARADTTRVASSRQESVRRGSAVRGRVGLRYLVVNPPEGPGFSQPGLDLRLDLAKPGVPVGLVVDMRGRRTYRTGPTGAVSVDRRDAVYQAAVLVRPGGPMRATIGRQYLPTVSSVSLFDGALVEYQSARFGAGAFAGYEPEPATMGWSNTTRDYGLFVEGRSSPGVSTRWTLAGGGVASYAGGVVNREFGFVQGSIATRALSLFIAQEIDLNRDWKAEAGEPAVSLTATFASLSARPAEWLNLQAGIDNRRNIRLYRDYATPEAVFDESFRQGAWAGASFSVSKHARFGLDGRATFGGADSATRTRMGGVFLSLEQFTPARLGVRGRLSRYTSPERTGCNRMGSPATSLLDRVRGTGGLREETFPGAPDDRWLGTDMDVVLGRSSSSGVGSERTG